MVLIGRKGAFPLNLPGRVARNMAKCMNGDVCRQMWGKGDHTYRWVRFWRPPIELGMYPFKGAIMAL